MPRYYDLYQVLATEEFSRSVKETYKRFFDEDPAYANVWLDRIDSYIKTLEHPSWLGTIDPEHYSDKYSHVQVPDTQTTIFLLVEGAQIFLITSGWCGRNWPEALRLMEPVLEQQLSHMKRLN